MPRPIIALLTDFGLHDHYVAAMKGVILGIAPEAALVDITHQVEPRDVASAALELAACWRDFPDGSIFLVVVDPGVGTPRRAIAVAAGRRFFVAPDNGILTLVLDEEPASAIVEITERQYLRPVISRTFEGRDRFAPAAAWLARGTDIQALGPPVSECVRLDVERPRAARRRLTGAIVKVDRFGNLISNIGAQMLERISGERPPLVSIGNHDPVPLVPTYGSVPAGTLCALVGSSGFLEVAVNGGSAARLLKAGRGARVVAGTDVAALDAADDA